jgi:predicted phage-related endonuclease
MRNAEIRLAVEELQNLYAQADLLKAEITAKESLIKEEMEARETEELNLGNVIIRFTSVLSNRFDTTAFKKLHSDLYNTFIKQVSSRRFSIA